MSLPVILRPDAKADVQEIFIYLENVSPGLGKKFLKRLRELLERIESIPEQYGAVWQDVRAARLRKFRFVIYYVATSHTIEVLAVLHGSRDSSVWRSRI